MDGSHVVRKTLSMGRYGGVNASTTHLYLVAVEKGVVVDGLPERVALTGGLESPEQLQAVARNISLRVGEIGASSWAVLAAESNYKGTHGGFAPRVAAETLVRLAAAENGADCRILSRPTVRSVLGLPRKGSLDSHVSGVVEPDGQYWTAGRNLAALVACAVEARVVAE